jgi:hypothetical protein
VTRRRRRVGALAAVAVLAGGVLAAIGHAVGSSAPFRVLDPAAEGTVPYALARPLWSDQPAPALPVDGVLASTLAVRGGEPARAALRILRREQRHGVLQQVLGASTARVVQLGELQAAGRKIGMTALLALPAARRSVRATVPRAGVLPDGRVRVRPLRFATPVLRDLLVDIDLLRGEIIGVEPGPGTRTSGWWTGPAPSPPAPATASAPAAWSLVRLTPHGPAFAAYDGNGTLGPGDRDWPVTLVFVGHATIASVKRGLRSAGFTGSGERRWLAYGAGGAVRFDGDRGVKTPCDAKGTDVHLRLYAPPATDHFTDPRYGEVVVATSHLDRGEGCSAPPRLFGFSEEAERRVADTVAARLGWVVQRGRIALGNAEPYRRDLAARSHLWWSDGRATVIHVP